MLVTSFFSFSLNVFKRCFPKGINSRHWVVVQWLKNILREKETQDSWTSWIWSKIPQCFSHIKLSCTVKTNFEHIIKRIAWQTNFEHIIKRIAWQCHSLTHYHTMPHFDALKIYRCGKHCEKRRNCLLKANSPFLTMFSILYGTYFFILNALYNVVCNLFQFGPV